MNSDSDQLYYAKRARIERERARTCSDSAAAIAHATMAAEYERRAGVARSGPATVAPERPQASRMESAQ